MRARHILNIINCYTILIYSKYHTLFIKKQNKNTYLLQVLGFFIRLARQNSKFIRMHTEINGIGVFSATVYNYTILNSILYI